MRGCNFNSLCQWIEFKEIHIQRNIEDGRRERLIKAAEGCVFHRHCATCAATNINPSVFLYESMVNHGVTVTEDFMYPSALHPGACKCVLGGS